MSGVLYVCGTPIGNLEDITLRQLRILREVDCIAAEDTRQTIKLLNRYEIKKPLISYHEHNKQKRRQEILDMLLAGQSLALVSDCGMPGISDPGEDLIQAAMEKGIAVTAVPGPTAAITGLILSGLASGSFIFQGFLPGEKAERVEILRELAGESRSLIFYEAPHHLKRSLSELLAALGDREAAVCRELTKIYEEIVRGKLSFLCRHFEGNTPRGEMVVVVEGADREALRLESRRQWEALSMLDHLDLYLAQGMDRKEAMKAVAKDRGLGKREVYASLQEERDKT